jgi:hypothetical protein
MIVRLTEKLSTKVKVHELMTLPLDQNRLADWTARIFAIDRTQYILITNTTTLYSVVVYGKGVTNANTLIRAMTGSLRAVMAKEGLGQAYDRQVAPHIADISFAKNLNRSIIGSMNRLAFYAEVHLAGEEMSLSELSSRLNNSWMTYDKKYDRPGEMFRLATQRAQ